LDSDSFREDPKPVFASDPDSKHLPALRHGDEAHSFTSVAQLYPTKPASQAHAYLPKATGLARITDDESVHTALFAHGIDEHSFTSTSQFIPAKPTGQEQLYLSTPSVHLPELLHGDDEHSSTSVSQLYPV
jgi:hypothetical protein